MTDQSLKTLAHWLREDEGEAPVTAEQLREWADACQRADHDAACWKALKARMRRGMSPTTGTWHLVRTSPTFGDEEPVSDWEYRIELAVKSGVAAE